MKQEDNAKEQFKKRIIEFRNHIPEVFIFYEDNNYLKSEEVKHE